MPIHKKGLRWRDDQEDCQGKPAPEKKSGRERAEVYPRWQMSAICILMQLNGLTFRDAENAVDGWGRSWNGRVPDHTTIARAFASLDHGWLDRMVPLTADMCMDDASETSEIGCGRLAADGTGVGTGRYGVQERMSKKGRGFQAYTRENVPEMAHSRGGGTSRHPSCKTTPATSLTPRCSLICLQDKAHEAAPWGLVRPCRQGVRPRLRLQGGP